MALWNQTATEGSNEKAAVVPTPTPTPAPTATPTTNAAPAVAPQATAIPVTRETVSSGHKESVFGAGVTIEGKIEGDADVRIAGKFKGDIQIKGDLSVEKGAHLAAKITAANVTLGGEVDGNVNASGQVKLLETGQMTGDLKASTLTVAAGSRMRGHVEFGWNSADAAKFVNGHANEEKKRS